MGVNKMKQRRCPPERADHLKATRFKPGQSGNPGGRPPTGRGLSRKLREMAGLPACSISSSASSLLRGSIPHGTPHHPY